MLTRVKLIKYGYEEAELAIYFLIPSSNAARTNKTTVASVYCSIHIFSGENPYQRLNNQ